MSIISLTDPILLTLDELTVNPELTHKIAILANIAFTRSKQYDLEKWLPDNIRFPNNDAVLSMMGKEGTMAVVLDKAYGNEHAGVEVQDANGDVRKGKLVACAAASIWKGGWDQEGSATETGWEMKAVCVDGDAQYLKKGLAIKVLGALEHNVVLKERTVLRNTRCIEDVEEDESRAEMGKKGVVHLWIMAAECINGVYWRKRGYTKVRSKVYSGIWGCRTSFEMVLLRKEIEFEVDR